MEMENWKPVIGWPEYEVSDQGRVRSLDRYRPGRNGCVRLIRGRVLGNRSRKGYLRVRFPDRQDKFVHVLVLEAFMGSRPAGHETRHLDGDKTNNNLANLAWGTSEENKADRKRHRLERLLAAGPTT